MPPSERARDGPRFKTLDKDDARRNREETTISLRKDKRQEQLQKKRFGANPQGMMCMPGPDSQQSVGAQAWAESNPEQLVAGVHSDDPNQQLPAVTQFRKLLSIERSPPIEEVIAAGVVPRFVQFLQVATTTSHAYAPPPPAPPPTPPSRDPPQRLNGALAPLPPLPPLSCSAGTTRCSSSRARGL